MGPRFTLMLGGFSFGNFSYGNDFLCRTYFLNGPVLTHPPPAPGGMQFRSVGRASVQLWAS